MVWAQTGGKKILEQFFDSIFFFLLFRFFLLNEVNEHTEKKHLVHGGRGDVFFIIILFSLCAMSYIHCALLQCSNFLFCLQKKLLLTFCYIKSNLGRRVFLCCLFMFFGKSKIGRKNRKKDLPLDHIPLFMHCRYCTQGTTVNININGRINTLRLYGQQKPTKNLCSFF